MTVRRFLHVLADHARNGVSNWRGYDAGFFPKLGLAVRNRSKALFSRDQCCGHLGQPGC